MIASLPMYDRRETAAANDALWALARDGLARAGVAAPEALTRDGDLWGQWTAPDLVLSQTCGLPLATKLRDKVRYVGSPEYDIDCPPGHYFSKVVARKGAQTDFNGACLAFNDPFSQSGWGAAQTFAAAHEVTFGRLLETGAHRLSAQAVADGRADLAVIDALTWKMIQRWDPCADVLQVIGQTPPTPATPYITGPNGDAEAIHAAMADAIAQLSGSDRETLGLKGIVHVPIDAYLAVTRPEPPALDITNPV